MKRCLILAVTALLTFSIGKVNAEQIQFKKLPRVIQKFLTGNFETDAIATIDKQLQTKAVSYIVDLKDGTKIEFDANGVIHRAAANKGQLLASCLVPEPIYTSLAKHYPRQQIVKFETIQDGYEIFFIKGGSITFNKEFNYRLINVRK